MQHGECNTGRQTDNNWHRLRRFAYLLPPIVAMLRLLRLEAQQQMKLPIVARFQWQWQLPFLPHTLQPAETEAAYPVRDIEEQEFTSIE